MLLSLLAILWVGYSSWSAGRTLGGQPLSSPLVAQWLAIAAGPLALLALAWLIFGRTRRREAEMFTRSVIAMRTEAQSLEALLAVLSQRINDSRTELTTMTQQLMQLGDETTGKLGGITQGFDRSSEKLKLHTQALDRAAESARNDIAVLLDDLPRAEETARGVSEQLRSIGAQSTEQAAAFGQQVSDLAERTRHADELIADATERLSARLAEIDNAGVNATVRVSEAEAGFSGVLDALLERTSATLDEIRAGINVQSAAVSALVDQASAGIGKAGMEASELLAANVDHANSAIETLSQRVAEQDRASQRMIAEIDRGLGLIDQRFTQLAAHGDERANRFLELLSRARAELDSMAAQASSQDHAIGAVAERTAALRESIDTLTDEIRDSLGTAIGEAHGGADRLSAAATSLRPEIAWIRDAAVEAGDRLSATGETVAGQQDRLSALLASVDQGVEGAQSRLAELGSQLAQVEQDASALSAQTAPALVNALVQVKEAASHAAERAREAIEDIIPASAGKLSSENSRRVGNGDPRERRGPASRGRSGRRPRRRSRPALRPTGLPSRWCRSVRPRRRSRLISPRPDGASRRRTARRSRGGCRSSSNSMHSAAIDVGKILSDEIDDKAWGAYLKGNRGVFTSRAVRLIDGSETRAIRAHYENEIEFQQSVNRYVHDFEVMLRRVMAERDGGMIAVTLLSSDMGKLYAALNQAIDKRR